MTLKLALRALEDDVGREAHYVLTSLLEPILGV